MEREGRQDTVLIKVPSDKERSRYEEQRENKEIDGSLAQDRIECSSLRSSEFQPYLKVKSNVNDRNGQCQQYYSHQQGIADCRKNA